MEISILFLGSGFALFLVLLAWGNKIRAPRRDIRELESKFIDNFETDKRTIRPLVKKSYEKLDKSPMENFLDKMDSLVEIMDNIKTEEDVEVIDQFKEVVTFGRRLEKFYKVRYLISLFFTFILFIIGLMSELTGKIKLNPPFSDYNLNAVYVFIFIILIFSILILMAVIYFLEEDFIVEIDETDSKMVK